MLLSVSDATICTHEPLKCHSNMHGTYIMTTAECKECKAKVVISIPMKTAMTHKELSILEYVEYRCRKALTLYARQAAGLPL